MKNTTYIKIFVAAALTFFFLHTRFLFAEMRSTVDGVEFKIEKISFGQWAKPRHHLTDDMIEKSSQGNEKLSYIAISYSLTNQNSQKKIDLDGKFSYALFDNFGNRYRAMRKPDDYKSTVLLVSKNFPSMYPGEVYGETLFFEAPISLARSVTLNIGAEGLRLNRPVELMIPLNANGPIDNVPVKSLADDKSKVVPGHSQAITSPQIASFSPDKIKIISPLPGVVLEQGQVARVQVSSVNGRLPKRVIVIALENIFQDNSPRSDNVYDLNIPANQIPGSYMINIIAEWPSGEVTSAETPFYIKGDAPLNIL